MEEIPEALKTLPVQEKAKFVVLMWLRDNIEKKDYLKIRGDDVIIVWWCKTLQNWKALVTTTLSNGLYFEVTHNGDKGETYLDAYKKADSVCFPDI